LGCFPAGQSLHAVAPEAEIWWAGHFSHLSEPLAAAKVPAGHLAHALPGCEVYPARQPSQESLSVVPSVPAGQSTQAAAPSAEEKVLEAHFLQDEAPSAE
jgi:hypothetical protein